MYRRPLQLTTFILIWFSPFLRSVTSNCDSLAFREGSQIKCFASRNSQTLVDCYQSTLPIGTVAKYGCDTPYYIETNSDLTESDKTLICNSRGKWVGRSGRFQLFSCTLNCGVTNLGLLSSFIIGGIPTKQSEWPWHAIIFLRPSPDKPFKYSCGGTLLKPVGRGFVIVTAAHCLANAREEPRNPSDIKIILGAEESSLEDIDQHSPEAQVFNVKEIVLHKSYDGRRSEYQSDIALVRLEEEITPRENILPVCLSKSGPEVGDIGHLVGFGVFNIDSSASSIKPRRASFQIVPSIECSEWRQRKLLPQEFCAGTMGLNNSCNGDSGGGMVFNGTDDKGRKRFYLQGIVSHGRVSLTGTGTEITCDTYSVYTRVSNYVEWIYGTTDRLYREVEHEEEIVMGPLTGIGQQPAITQITTTISNMQNPFVEWPSLPSIFTGKFGPYFIDVIKHFNTTATECGKPPWLVQQCVMSFSHLSIALEVLLEQEWGKEVKPQQVASLSFLNKVLNCLEPFKGMAFECGNYNDVALIESARWLAYDGGERLLEAAETINEKNMCPASEGVSMENAMSSCMNFRKGFNLNHLLYNLCGTVPRYRSCLKEVRMIKNLSTCQNFNEVFRLMEGAFQNIEQNSGYKEAVARCFRLP